MNRIALVLAFLATACGGSGAAATDAFPSQPIATLTSDNGALVIDVRTSPDQPPSRGEVSVQLSIRDATTGAPAQGLALTVTPWMPAMAHGSSVTPSVTESGPGTYLVTNVDLFMPGTWQLRTIIASTPVDHVAPSFDIP